MLYTPQTDGSKATTLPLVLAHLPDTLSVTLAITPCVRLQPACIRGVRLIGSDKGRWRQ